MGQRRELAVGGCVIALLCLALAPAGAQAAFMATFDDLGDEPPVGTSVPDGYGGLNWEQIRYRQGNNGGYRNGMVSAPCVAFGSGAGFGSVSGDRFDFRGAYFAGAWRDGLNIRVDGYQGADLVYSDTITVSYYQATWFGFDYLDVDQVTFTSSGGYDADESDDGIAPIFVMDDFTMPEPATLYLFGLGSAACRRWSR